MTFSRKPYSSRDDVEKYGRAGQATDDNIIRRMLFACWMTKATDTQTMQYLLLFHGNNDYAIAPQCYVTRTLPILFSAAYVASDIMK
jgi:hypothetical protein